MFLDERQILLESQRSLENYLSPETAKKNKDAVIMSSRERSKAILTAQIYSDTLTEHAEQLVDGAMRRIKAKRNSYVRQAFQSESAVKKKHTDLKQSQQNKAIDLLSQTSLEIPPANFDFLTVDSQSVDANLNTYLHGLIPSELHMLGQQIHQPFETVDPQKIGEGVVNQSSDFLLREFVNKTLFEEINRNEKMQDLP